MQQVDYVGVLKVLKEAISWGRGGEVVLRCGADTGRVFFAEGKIAWSTVSTIVKTFTQYLVEQTSLGEDEAREAFEDCKRTGKNFGETVVEWGLIDETSLRRLLLQHISACLLEIFCWPEVESMFMPDEKPYKATLTFDFPEILQNVLGLDVEGRLPFRGMSAAQILDELKREEATEAVVPTRDESPAVEVSPAGMRSAPEPVVSSFSSEIGAVDGRAPEQAPVLPIKVKQRKSRRASLPILLIMLAAVAVVTYFSLDQIFGTAETHPRAPVPVPSHSPEPEPVPRPEPVVSEPEPAHELRPGIVAFAVGEGTGSIRVVSKPRNARVYLDGIDTGKFTPVTLTDVQAKRLHVVMVEKRKTLLAFRTVDLDPNQKVIVRLRPRRKGRKLEGRVSVRVESDPPGADIYVNGGKVKRQAPTEIRLRADRSSRLQLVLEGHDRWERIVRPAPGLEITILARMN